MSECTQTDRRVGAWSATSAAMIGFVFVVVGQSVPSPAQLVFVNARLFFVGSDDVPAEAKIEATHDINKALEAGWSGLNIAEIVPLEHITRAHELVEHPVKPGRVIVEIR